MMIKADAVNSTGPATLPECIPIQNDDVREYLRFLTESNTSPRTASAATPVTESVEDSCDDEIRAISGGGKCDSKGYQRTSQRPPRLVVKEEDPFSQTFQDCQTPSRHPRVFGVKREGVQPRLIGSHTTPRPARPNSCRVSYLRQTTCRFIRMGRSDTWQRQFKNLR